VREQLANAAHAELHLVKHQQKPVPIAQLPELAQKLDGNDPDATFALHRLDEYAGCLWSDRRFDSGDVPHREHIEAGHLRPEAVEVFLIPSRGNGGQRTPVERALERNEPVPLRPAGNMVIAARQLDRALHRLGTGVAEEYAVRKRCRAKPLRQTLLARDTVKV